MRGCSPIGLQDRGNYLSRAIAAFPQGRARGGYRTWLNACFGGGQ